MSIALKHANGLPAGVFKVQPLIHGSALNFQTMHHLFNMTAPLLQQSINELANLHIGDVPPPSRLGVGRSVEARDRVRLRYRLRARVAYLNPNPSPNPNPNPNPNPSQARMMLTLPEKLQSQMRLRLAQMDTAQVITEIRAYKVDPPADVYKVCKAILVLLGHGKWAGPEHELKEWDDLRPLITRNLIKDMQAFEVTARASDHQERP